MPTKELLAIFALSLVYGFAVINVRIIDQEQRPFITNSDQLLDLKGQGQVLGTSSESHSKAWLQVFF